MTMILLLAAFLPLAAQADRPAAIRDLAAKLSKEGLSGRLAAAAQEDSGVQAIEERIDFLLAGETAPLERDPMTRWIESLFTRDAAGDLAARPGALDGLHRRVAEAPSGRAGFEKQADALAARLADDPLSARAKAWWTRPDFRTAFFHRHPAELRERARETALRDLILLGLEGNRIPEARREGLHSRIGSFFARLEAVGGYEKAFLQELAKVPDASARELLSTDAAILVLVGRLLRQQDEGSPIQIGGIMEGDPDAGKPPVLSFNLPLAELADDVRAALKTAAWLGGRAAEIAQGLADGPAEAGLREFLGNARARALVAEAIEGEADAQRRRAAEILDSVLTDSFVDQAGKLAAKPDRWENAEALDAEYQAVLDEFEGSLRQDFDRVAERCLDPGAAALFSDKGATYVLVEQRDRAIEDQMALIRLGGVDLFARTYLRDGAVRPDRAARVEAILRRAEEIKKQAEAEK